LVTVNCECVTIIDLCIRSQESTEEMDDDTLYKLSLEIEPRDGSIPVAPKKKEPEVTSPKEGTGPKKKEPEVTSPKEGTGSMSPATAKIYKSKLQKLLGEGAPADMQQSKLQKLLGEGAPGLQPKQKIVKTESNADLMTLMEESVDNSLIELQAQLDSLDELTFDES
jgi:hypothetical protein